MLSSLLTTAMLITQYFPQDVLVVGNRWPMLTFWLIYFLALAGRDRPRICVFRQAQMDVQAYLHACLKAMFVRLHCNFSSVFIFLPLPVLLAILSLFLSHPRGYPFCIGMSFAVVFIVYRYSGSDVDAWI
ncbi:uncharacterized protein EI97DRAFT_313180 [Westerdykella ornata]|uniref:Uncharacterized protein n=1 Tax=Westerdykella ornata TaxID=318751 RepID=A0A6A6JKN2_WESOR|nr:uncharacterized protein EI97DRAFT_313180 [Westerdykella ornata]KAF2277210.1 hypothetical protein EI97DRAFT_313180 [Westerdykella ornata]